MVYRASDDVCVNDEDIWDLNKKNTKHKWVHFEDNVQKQNTDDINDTTINLTLIKQPDRIFQSSNSQIGFFNNQTARQVMLNKSQISVYTSQDAIILP